MKKLDSAPPPAVISSAFIMTWPSVNMMRHLLVLHAAKLRQDVPGCIVLAVAHTVAARLSLPVL